MIIIFSIITAVYVIIIGVLLVAYGQVKSFEYTSENPISRFSIVIPFRNEAQNLEALLNSIIKIKYPKALYEIILVDDESEDNSVDIIQFFLNNYYKEPLNISLFKNKRYSNSPKKDAIEIAISHAKFEWIATTDADCLVKTTWLQSLDAFIQNKAPKLVVAPVTYNTSNTFLDSFQLHDFLSLQTATIAGFGIGTPFLCNGANLCYSKSVFKELNGFEGNNTIASGDDLFFLEKVATIYSKDVHYLKSTDAIVFTTPEPTLKALCNQRVRWASKTSAYSNVFSKALAFVVLLMNATLVLGFVLALLRLFSWQFFLILFAVKFCIDFFFILRSSSFFKQNSRLKNYPFISLMYPFFVVAVSCYTMFFKYKWKDRSFKK